MRASPASAADSLAVISRALVILLAFIAAAYRASQGAWVESTGLAALGAGLVLLRAAGTRPALKRYAWLCFSVTAIAVIASFARQYL